MKRTALRNWTLLACLLATAAPALASSGEAHTSIAPTLLALVLVLGAAKLGADVAVRLGQVAVLGELLMGVVLGNLNLMGVTALDQLSQDPALNMLAELGVVLLLFEVGLESTVHEMMRVGVTAVAVAALGVVAPFALGYGVSAWLLTEASWYVHLFIGATLTATSVGITARVLKDLGKSQTREARIILGAAVVDDVLGLVILAVVTGIITSTNAGKTLSYGEIGLMLLKSVGFLVGMVMVGMYFAPRMYKYGSRLKAPGLLLTLSLMFCFLLSWAANAIGLAPIVGAFAAGLILEDFHYEDMITGSDRQLEEHLEPITSILVPVFFVVMGMRIDVLAFAEPGVIGFAAALTAVAVLGKQACSLGAGSGVDRLSIGLGMVPRGEVGLVFANIGVGLTVQGERVLTTSVFSAIVVMIIVTTMLTPPVLKWSLQRHRPQA